MRGLLEHASQRAIAYLESLEKRAVAPDPQAIRRLAELDISLPETGVDPIAVFDRLDEIGSDATVASAGSRYFGFVIGGSLPVSLAAQWLAGAWDQNGGLRVASPIGAKLEDVSIRWLLDVLDLPPQAGVGFVTGATMANFTALAAARHAILARRGWDVEDRGLFGAPPITVIVGDEVHVSLLKALSMLGLGRERVIRVPADTQGRMRADALSVRDENTIVCIQAGNVNTGAFDPAEQICRAAHEAGAWVHADGAFGLWALACPSLKSQAAGLEQADSWATDAHKWLNVPYDSGLAFCRNEKDLRAAMSATAAYLLAGEQREPMNYTPELSKRARGVEIWAALLSMGRRGLAELIERDCKLAERFASGLSAAGFTVLNEVCLNQVLVSFGDAARTDKVIAAVQREGTAWFGGTVWQGHTAMRISVSGWSTSEEDVDRSVAVIVKAAQASHD
jgi:glutamate/tyrosine decarboxylase-like PLP-dependent enzyme